MELASPSRGLCSAVSSELRRRERPGRVLLPTASSSIELLLPEARSRTISLWTDFGGTVDFGSDAFQIRNDVAEARPRDHDNIRKGFVFRLQSSQLPPETARDAVNTRHPTSSCEDTSSLLSAMPERAGYTAVVYAIDVSPSMGDVIQDPEYGNSVTKLDLAKELVARKCEPKVRPL